MRIVTNKICIFNGDVGMCEPQGKNEWYFFTRRKKRYGSRPDRTAGNGFWKATGSNDAVRDGKKQSIIGYKRALSFFHGQQSEKNLNNKTCWLMHECQLRAPEEETEPSDRKGKRALTTINPLTPGSQQNHKLIKR